MGIMTNRVLVRKSHDSKGFFIDKSFEPEKHAQTSAEVLGVCSDLFFSYDDIYGSSLIYKTDNELRVGDIVYFHYLCTLRAKKDGVMFADEFYLRYDDIFCLKRDGELIMLNGWILVEAEFKKPVSLFDIRTKEESENQGTIRHIGSCNTGYLEGEGKVDLDIFNVGDIVYFGSEDAIPIEYYNFNKTLDKGKNTFYRMQRPDILGKLTT